MSTIIGGSSPSITFSDSTTQTTAFTGSASQITSGTLPSAQLPTGSVLQVVNATYGTETSTTSTSYVTTNITASITPKFSTSKILVICTVPAQSNGSCNCAITLFRGTVAGTIIFGGNGFANMAGSTYSSVASVAYLDSPATTSSTTYTVGFKSGTGSTVWTSVSNTVGTITLMEIA